MPQLQIPVKPKTPGSSVSHIIPNIAALTKPLQNSVGPPNVTISSSSPIPFPQKQTSSPPIMSVTPTIVKKVEPRQNTAFRQNVGNNSENNANSSTPSYKDGGKTTFKTMYKCVFNTEICNHIAKDRSKMKQHLFMHVEYKPWSCDYCNMTASQSSHVKNHVRAEHPREEISFQYKQHNYLEKHIETFLQKGVFTVPVNEYRSIMDMKGSTQKSQYDYSRDVEGYLLCPHCDYRTKSGGMSDHIKMKHKQPRFKCHWCDYKAFYRSEIRKHHRKERGHAHLEFMTEELDITDVLGDTKEGNDTYVFVQATLSTFSNLHWFVAFMFLSYQFLPGSCLLFALNIKTLVVVSFDGSKSQTNMCLMAFLFNIISSGFSSFKGSCLSSKDCVRSTRGQIFITGQA